MCHACVTDSVKRRMLSRRQMLSAAPAAAVTAAATMAAQPLRAQDAARVVDMTHTVDADFPTYSGPPGISIDRVAAFAESGYNAFDLALHEHTGTHVDAPLHFSPDGQSVDEIAVERLVCPLCVIDIRARADADPDAFLTPDDLTAWIGRNGDIPDGACVAMNSGWQAHVATPRFVGLDAEGVRHFPGFHAEAAQMLLEDTGAAAIAVDTLSLDHGPSAGFETHYAWLPANRYGIECLAGLDAVPEAGASLIVGAPKHRGGSGGPARIMALV